VADDQALGVDAVGDRLDGETMEAVAPDPPLLPPRPRDRVGRGLYGDRTVEGRVEDGDVRNVGKGGPRVADPA
jgi:hypothetical protein